jgi:vitamin B12 transporter
LQAQLSSDLKFIRLTGGVDWVTYDIEDSYTAGSNSYDNPAAFLLVKSKLLNDRLILSAGLRFDKFDVEAVDGRKVSDDNLTPGVGATYKITEGLSIRTNYAEAFKMHSADQLFMFNDYSAWGFGIWSGNENLKPEKSKTYEIGIDYTKGTISTGLTYYITDFKDKIGYTYIPEENLTQYQNISGR